VFTWNQSDMGARVRVVVHLPSETSSDWSVRSLDEFELGSTIMEKLSPEEEKVESSTAVIRAPRAKQWNNIWSSKGSVRHVGPV